jgi:two-component system phosphate regulon sensor histidine kinase PhoR
LKTRALICYLLITIILISGLEVYLSLFLKRYYISRLKEELFIQAELVKDLLSEKKELDTFCKRYKEITGARITVIDPAGRVLGDSEQSALKMENHLDRPEIKEAMFSGRGSSVRFSNTIKKDFLYVALLYKGLFIRLSRPLDTVNSEISRIRMPAMLSTLLALILVVLIWSYQSKRLRREIGEIIEFADKVAAGNSGSLFIENEGELSRLGARISYMAGELQKRLEEAKREKQTVEGVLKNMKEGLLIVDEKGSVLLMNESLRKLLGVTSVKEGMTAAEILRNAEIISLIEESRQLNDTISRRFPCQQSRAGMSYIYQ